MQQIIDIISRLGGLRSIANELGVSEQQAASGAEALAPAILGGFKRQTQERPNGLQGLGGLLAQLGGGGLLDDVLAPRPTDVGRGNAVLGEIFGSKDVSRTIAQDAAGRTGLAPDMLKKMLPMLAMLVAGYIARQHGGGGAGGPAAPGGFGRTAGDAPAQTGDVAATAGNRPTPSGLRSMLDLDGDGNPLDDLLRMAGKALR